MGPSEILLGIAFPVLIGIGTGVALTQVLPWEFWAARGCFIASALIAAGFIAYWLWPEVGESVLWRMIVAALMGAILLPTLIFLLHWVDLREDYTSTRLYPASSPMPSLPPGCEAPPDALIIFLGSNVAWASRMPHTVIEMSDDSVLQISRDNDELAIKVLKIFDDRGDIIARIENGDFWVRNDIRKTRTRNSLTVYDHSDQEVLNLNFLNKKAISVLGNFGHPRVAYSIKISPESLVAGGMTMTGSCFGENNVDFAVR
jgi:hypothetical protein